MKKSTIKFNNNFNFNITKCKNALIVGNAGSGKSTFLHGIINLLLKNASDNFKLFLIDLKKSEFEEYNDSHFLFKPIAYSYDDAFWGLMDIVSEIEDRMQKFNKAGTYNIDKYNKLALDSEKLPHIIVVIDEALDFLNENAKGEKLLTHLACNGYNVGVHLIISTQRANIVPIPLKANLQTRVCFMVADEVESLIAINFSGGEKLKRGEFLYRDYKTPSIKKYKMGI